ncbi:peroxiredoxin family protein [Rhodohalobacter mucosus]|uniref:Thioredoxin domain-containing protein n=1 Tax=Rhodohalobacter mucosus TaxID=2079485 RepID=A0A316TTK2_9BACT|nr:TlpA disulfide reductase family protein [Rhodohalobacter mucosus]PWN06305.1 hypothetical protein DDZ15_10810 [Rhodohalobacter mucosus]
MKHYSSILIHTITAFAFILVSCSNIDSRPGADTSEAADSETASHSENTLMAAPDFEVTTLEGESISLQKSLESGKPVVVYFTASWCPVCARNWPVLSEVYPEFEDRLTLVAVSIDPTDTEDVMRELAENEDFLFPSTAGRPEIMIDFGVESQATTVGVNLDGNIAFKKSKQALTADEFRELFSGLLN